MAEVKEVYMFVDTDALEITVIKNAPGYKLVVKSARKK